MQWFRVYNEIIDDPKIARMDGETFRCFVYLLAVVSEQETEGIIEMSLQDIAWRIRISTEILEKSIQHLIENRIIRKEKNKIIIINWNKRQFASDDVSKRVKRYRQKQCNVTGNVTSNVIETETDTDTEQRQIQRQSRIETDTETEEKTAFLKELKSIHDQIKEKYPKFNIQVFIQTHLKHKNQQAIIHTLKSLLTDKHIENPMAWCEAIIKKENMNYNARDSEKQCNEYKRMPIGMGSMKDIMKSFGG